MDKANNAVAALGDIQFDKITARLSDFEVVDVLSRSDNGQVSKIKSEWVPRTEEFGVLKQFELTEQGIKKFSTEIAAQKRLDNSARLYVTQWYKFGILTDEEDNTKLFLLMQYFENDEQDEKLKYRLEVESWLDKMGIEFGELPSSNCLVAKGAAKFVGFGQAVIRPL